MNAYLVLIIGLVLMGLAALTYNLLERDELAIRRTCRISLGAFFAALLNWMVSPFLRAWITIFVPVGKTVDIPALSLAFTGLTATVGLGLLVLALETRRKRAGLARVEASR